MTDDDKDKLLFSATITISKPKSKETKKDDADKTEGET